MSNGAVVAGGLVFLAVAATSVVMFGNVGATTNNLPVRYPLLWIKSFIFHSFTYFSLLHTSRWLLFSVHCQACPLMRKFSSSSICFMPSFINSCMNLDLSCTL
jgi:hypothetical protein